jgi:ribonuclease HI
MSLEAEKRILVCCLLWQWWSNRNKINANEKAKKTEEVVAQIKYWTAKSLQYCRKGSSETGAKAVMTWGRPEEDIIKINVDASFLAVERRGGWGFVARDHHGDVVGAGAGKLHHVESAASAEAQACDAALHQAAQWGMTRIVVESDAQNLVRAVQSTNLDRAPEGVVYRDIRLFAQLNFSLISFVYSPRNCNKVAHALVAIGVSSQAEVRLWTEDLPNDVKLLVASDLTEPTV